ncbi:MAG: exodeoxyribonuclease VII large subunit, partial [Myxococcota bacterium]
ARRGTLVEHRGRLARHDPRTTLRADRRVLDATRTRLRDAGRLPIQRRRHALVRLTAALEGLGRPIIQEARAAHAAATGRLDALSPLRVLDRGYAIALKDETGRAIRRTEEVQPGDTIRVRVSDGTFRARVQSDTEDEP